MWCRARSYTNEVGSVRKTVLVRMPKLSHKQGERFKEELNRYVGLLNIHKGGQPLPFLPKKKRKIRQALSP